MNRVVIHSDGSCAGNPGPGGWAALLEHGRVRWEISGATLATTNNRMELQAAIEALSRLKAPCEVEFHTDSQYVRQGITSWISRWKVRRWRTLEGKPVKNADLWRQLDSQAARHHVQWHWVRGHAGQADNERCDELAAAAIRELRTRHTPAEFQAALIAFREEQSAMPAIETPPPRGRGLG